jgi:AbrB family looped-hinge helix DNA binding protein
MALIRRSKITRKGQVTIPVEFREKYDFKEGDVVLFEDRDGRITIQHPDDVEDWTAGVLRPYTNGEYLTPDEIRDLAEQAIADQAMDGCE